MDHIRKRLIEKAERNTTTGCLVWKGTRHVKLGYGQISVGPRDHAKNWLAHRLSWVANRGPIPAGMFVCHHCDNRLCIEPSHLFLGSPKQNSGDMVSKGRQARGRKIWTNKLTEAQVTSIRSDNRLQKDIAAVYGVHKSLISLIKRRKVWTHLP